MDRYPPARERQRYPAGPDAQLQRPAAARQLHQQVNGGLDGGGLEHLAPVIVIGGGYALAEKAILIVHWWTVPRLRAARHPGSGAYNRRNPQFSIRRAAVKSASQRSVGSACNITPISVPLARCASNSRQLPAALVLPVLIPMAPR